MSGFALLLCEGPHDQAALAELARACCAWAPVSKKEELPSFLEDLYPVASGAGRTWRKPRDPDVLRRGEAWLAIRSLDSDGALLGRPGVEISRRALAAAALEALGVVVDADDRSVAARRDSYRAAYQDLTPLARNVAPGVIAEGRPRLGLWIAPDNSSPGSLLVALLGGLRCLRGDLERRSAAFVDAQGWDTQEERLKALLGAAGQVDAPAAALHTAIRTRRWFERALRTVSPIRELADFVDALA